MEWFWLTTAALFFGILYAILYLLEELNRNYWRKQGVPYYSSVPIIGVMKDLLLMRKGVGEIFNSIYRECHGERFVGFFQFLTPSILIRDPELINRVLIKDFSHFEDRGPPIRNPKDLFSMAFGNMTGDEWRLVRHKLMPSFSCNKMKMMFGSVEKCSEQVVVYLADKVERDIEVRGVISRYVLNVIGNIAFGLNIDTLNEKEEESVEFFKHSSLFFRPSFTLLLKFIISMTSPILKNMFNLSLTNEKVDKFFLKLSKDIIKYRRETGTRRNDFLQLMLDEREKEQSKNDFSNSSVLKVNGIESVGRKFQEELFEKENTTSESKTSVESDIFTEEFIAAQTFIFISGGSESVAAALSFVIFELATHQDLQQRVQEEIDKVLSSNELNYESLKKFTYMEQFINETFRMHPLGPATLRICTKDYKIPGSEVVIRKGNCVNIPHAIQMDAQYFPDPLKFDPDRFRDMDAIPKGVFLPFGAGPRICIAMRLSMLEMKVLLVKLLSKYSVTLSDKTRVPLQVVKTSFLVAVEGGVWIKLHQRQ